MYDIKFWPRKVWSSSAIDVFWIGVSIIEFHPEYATSRGYTGLCGGGVAGPGAHGAARDGAPSGPAHGRNGNARQYLRPPCGITPGGPAAAALPCSRGGM